MSLFFDNQTLFCCAIDLVCLYLNGSDQAVQYGVVLAGLLGLLEVGQYKLFF